MASLTLIQTFAVPCVLIGQLVALPASTLLYIATRGFASLVKLDYSTSTQTPSSDTDSATHVLFDGARFWVDDISPSVETTVNQFDLSPALIGSVDTTLSTPQDLATDGASIFAADPNQNVVSQMNAGGLIGNLASGGSGPIQTSTPLIATAGDIWYVNATGGAFNFRQLSGAVILALPAVADPSTGLCFDGANFWYSDFTNNQILKISPAGAILGTFPLGSPLALAFDGTNIWAASGTGFVSVFDLSGTLLANLFIGGRPLFFAFSGGFAFVSVTFGFNQHVAQLGFVAGPTAGGLIGTFAGQISAGKTGGGTK